MDFETERLVLEKRTCAHRNKCYLGKKSHLVREKNEENVVGQHCKECGYCEWRKGKIVVFGPICNL